MRTVVTIGLILIVAITMTSAASATPENLPAYIESASAIQINDTNFVIAVELANSTGVPVAADGTITFKVIGSKDQIYEKSYEPKLPDLIGASNELSRCNCPYFKK
jgi:hypothetical protein